MHTTLVTLVPLAIVIAVCPIGLLELMLVLFSARWRINSLVLLTSIVVLSFLTPLVIALGYSAVTSETVDSGPSTLATLFRVILGGLFLLMALGGFRKRNDHSMPAMLGKIEGMGPGAVALLSLGITVANPKNLAILVSAGQALGAAGFSSGREVVVSALFALVASSVYLILAGIRFFGGSRTDGMMEKIRGWLVRWNQWITFVLFAVLGVLFLVKGLIAILG